MSRRWLPTALWAAFILVLTSVPAPAGPPGVPGVDKVVHIVLYAILGALAVRASTGSALPAPSLAATLAGVALFAAADEIHQVFLPWRSGDLGDWFADVAGGVIGIAITAAVAGRRPQPS